MKKKLFFLAVLLLTVTFLWSCGDKDEKVEVTPLNIIEDEGEDDFYNPEETSCDHEPEVVKRVEGNCETFGYTVYRCAKCEADLGKVYDTEYGDHQYKNVNEYTKGDCLTPGKTVKKRCSVCGLVGETVYDEVVGDHVYKVTETHEATCMEYGYTVYTCKNCGATKKETGSEKAEHDFTVRYTAGADCLHCGETVYTCTVCGTEERESSGICGPHTFASEDGTSHRCTKCGLTGQAHTFAVKDNGETHTEYCNLCGYQKTAAAHTYGAPTERAATCYADGLRTEVCTQCKHKNETVISKLNHSYTEDVVYPSTCTVKGYTVKACVYCKAEDESTKTELPTVDHTWGTPTYTPSTCREYGVNTYTCSVCGTRKTEEDILSGYAAHTYTYRTTEEKHIRYCKECGTEFAEEAHGLTYADNEDGQSHTLFCSVCGYNRTAAHYIKEGDSACACGATQISYTEMWDVSAKSNGTLYAYYLYTERKELGKTVSSGVLTFTGRGDMKDFSVAEKPAWYEKYREKITEVRTAGTTETLGAYCCYDLPNLKKITVCATVRAIGKDAFYGCTALEEIAFYAKNCGDFLRYNGTFGNVGKFGEGVTVTVGSEVSNIPEFFLYPGDETDVPNVKAVVGSVAAVLSVGRYAFYQSSANGALVFNKVEKIGDYAFGGTKFSSVAVGDAVKSVGAHAFSGCAQTLLTVGGCTERLGAYAFYGCTYLDSIDFSAVTTVPDYAFADTGLWNITLNGVENIGSHAFYGAKHLKKVIFSDDTKTVGAYAFCGCDLLTASLPDTLTELGDYAFADNGALKEVVLGGDALEKIGDRAFSGCVSLTAVTLPNGIKTVGEGAFDGDVLLTGLELPTELVTIERYAFRECRRLFSVTLGEKVTAIGDSAFLRCNSLVEIDNRSGLELTEGTNGYGNVATYALRVYNGNKDTSYLSGTETILYDGTLLVGYVGSEASVTVPTGIDVYKYAFYNNKTLKNLTVRSESIGQYAFYGCTALNDVLLSGTVTIGGFAFANCGRIETFVLPDTIEAASDKAKDDVAFAFSGTRSVRLTVGSDDIVDMITSSVGSNAWYDSLLSGTESILFTNRTKATLPLVAQFTLTQDGSDLRAEINALEGVGEWFSCGETEYELRQIAAGGYRLTLRGTGTMTDFASADDVPWKEKRDNIVEVVFADGFGGTNIGKNAFYGLSGVTSLTVPESIARVGDNAFFGMKSLTELVWNARSCADFAAENSVFDGVGKNGWTVVFGTTTERIPAFFAWTNGREQPTLIGVSKNGTAGFSVGESAFRAASFTAFPFDNVTAFGKNAFRECVFLERIVIGSKVTAIGDNAFYNCTAAEEIVYSATATPTIAANNGIFYRCGSLTDGTAVTVTSGVTVLPDYLLNPSETVGACAPSVASASLPDTLLKIGAYAFAYCDGVEEIEVPSSVVQIGVGAFLRCDGLIRITVPATQNFFGAFFGASSAEGNGRYVPKTLEEVTLINVSGTLNDRYFYDCDHIERISATGLSGIGKEAFRACSALIEVVGAESVSTVGENAFSDCTALQTVTVSDGVDLGDGAFSGCTALRKVIFGDDATFGSGVFSGCTLTDVTVGGSGELKTESSVLLRGSSLIAYIASEGQTECTVPNTVTEIFGQAFAGKTDLRKITFGANVQTVGERAFEGCVALQTVDATASVQLNTIGEYAFFGCSSLVSVLFPTTGATVKSFKTGAFENCVQLKTFSVPNSVTEVGEYAFADCRSLVSVTFGGTSLEVISGYAFYGCVSLTGEFNVPSGVKIIGESAFEQCNLLKKIVLPATLTSVADRAFTNCRNVEEIILPNGVTSVGDGILSGCAALKVLQIGTGILSVSQGMLSGCGALEKLTIPFIGSDGKSGYPFGYIFGTETYEGSVLAEQTYILKNKYVTERFYLPSALKSVTIAGGDLTYGAFYGCTSLEEVNLSKMKITAVAERAFNGCVNITKITLPSSVTTVKPYAYYNCRAYGCDGCTEKMTVLDKTAFLGTAFYNDESNWEDGALYLPTDGGRYYVVDGDAAYTGVCTVRESAIYILPSAFVGVKFERLILPEGLNAVGEKILENAQIKSLTMPAVKIRSVKTENGKQETVEETVTKLASLYGYDNNSSLQSGGSSSLTELTWIGDVETEFCKECTFLKTVAVRGTEIGIGAFDGCTGLTAVTLTGVKKIRQYAFRGCASIAYFTVPDTANSEDSVGIGVLAGCSGIRSVTMPIVYGGSIGYLFTETDGSVGENNAYVPDGLKLVQVTFPTTGSLPKGCFYTCDGIRDFIFGAKMSYINENAFLDCADNITVVIVGAMDETEFDPTVRPTGNSEYVGATKNFVYFDQSALTYTYGVGDEILNPLNNGTVAIDSVEYSVSNTELCDVVKNDEEAAKRSEESGNKVVAGTVSVVGQPTELTEITVTVVLNGTVGSLSNQMPCTVKLSYTFNVR